MPYIHKTLIGGSQKLLKNSQPSHWLLISVSCVTLYKKYHMSMWPKMRFSKCGGGRFLKWWLNAVNNTNSRSTPISISIETYSLCEKVKGFTLLKWKCKTNWIKTSTHISAGAKFRVWKDPLTHLSSSHILSAFLCCIFSFLFSLTIILSVSKRLLTCVTWRSNWSD